MYVFGCGSHVAARDVPKGGAANWCKATLRVELHGTEALGWDEIFRDEVDEAFFTAPEDFGRLFSSKNMFGSCRLGESCWVLRPRTLCQSSRVLEGTLQNITNDMQYNTMCMNIYIYIYK